MGYIIAASQKGEYGAIELVFGLDKEEKYKVYISTGQEKEIKNSKKKSF